jgi:hypothetical protein
MPRAIVLDLAAGESLSDHEVHERAWVIVTDGAIEVNTATGEHAEGGPGLLIELAPAERHEVLASSNAWLLRGVLAARLAGSARRASGRRGRR